MRRIATRLACLLLVAACAAPEPLPPDRVELAASDRAARRWSETRKLDFGTGAARAALWNGWGPDERLDSTSFVWGGGESSRLLLWLVEPRDVELRLRGWAYPFADGGGVEVRFLLNGDEVARRTIGPSPETVELAVRKRHWVSGENRLELFYSRHHPTPGDPPWAVAWDGLRLEEGETAEGTVREEAKPGSIVLAAGSAIEWDVSLPDGAVLVWDDLAFGGGARARIEIVRADGRRAVLSPRGGAGRLEAPRPADAPGSLAGISLGAAGAAGELEITGLRVHRPPPPAAAASPALAIESLPERPNLIVYLIDTLRADRLGAYGYARPTSPRIDAFAKQSILFREGRAQAPWTRPAVATILTGLPPWRHGVEERSSVLPESIPTLAERLRDAGYDTALFTTNANIAARFGFAQGWDEFRALYDRVRGVRRHVDSAEIHRRVVDWFERRAARGERRPFLLFVHTLDPHDPYRPAEEFRSRLAADVDVELGCCGSAAARRQATEESPEAARARAAAASALYDAEVAQNDDSFGALLDELARRGLDGATAVLLTSDHGEEFLDHGGWKHGWTVYEEMLRVPFVLRLPGGIGGGVVVDAPAEQIDVVPTLLALAGLPPADDLPGRNLVDRSHSAPLPARTSLARLLRGGVVLESAKSGEWKLIRQRGAWTAPLGWPPFRMFDLASDPRELDDLALHRPFERRRLDGEIERAMAVADGATAQTTAIDAELDEALRALGYL